MDLLMAQAPWQSLGKSVFRPPYDQNIRALKYFFTIQYSMAYSIQFSIYSVICRKFSMFSYGPRESKTVTLKPRVLTGIFLSVKSAYSIIQGVFGITYCKNLIALSPRVHN